MTDEERKRKKPWAPAVKAAIDAANEASGKSATGPSALAELLGISRIGIYQWGDEVPTNHAMTLWEQLGLHPTVTCPSHYPERLFQMGGKVRRDP